MTTIRTLTILFIVIINNHTVIISQGCPVTNDPLTVEKAQWEINTGLSLERSANTNTYGIPVVELNYGLEKNIQFRYQIPFFIRHETGTSVLAEIGKSTAGIKWRFWNDENHKFGLSVFPQISLNIPINGESRIISSEGTDILLPLSCIKEFGCNTGVIEAGRMFNTKNEGGWFYCLLYARQLPQAINIIAEAFGITDYRFQNNELFLNIGTTVDLSPVCILQLAAGNTIIHPLGEGNKFIGYIGLQFKI